MGVRNLVKRFLRIFGHAMVTTVHERLDNIDQQLTNTLDRNRDLAQNQAVLAEAGNAVRERLDDVDRQFADILAQNTHLAQNQTALLQFAVHLVETMPQLQAEVRHVVESLPRIQSEVQGSGRRLASLVRDHCASQPDLQALSQAQEAALALLRPSLAGVLNLEREYAATRDRIASLEPVARETQTFLANEALRQVCVETCDYASTNPELGLMSFLYSHLPGRKALDIGAHIGEVSGSLLKSGYEVYAFEPYPPSYRRLTERFQDNPAFHPFNVALGAADAELPLHLVRDLTNDRRYDDPTVFHSLAQHGMPEGLSFRETIPVPVKKLSDLHRNGMVPADISLVKIDTEGYDLEVIRGMDGHRYPVVAVEFWDAHIPFAEKGLLYTVESIAHEMARRNYFWYIVLYRVWGQNQTAFFCNHDRPAPGSWGNLFFFRDHDTFQQAQQWCGAVLPRTYFKAVPASQAATQ